MERLQKEALKLEKMRAKKEEIGAWGHAEKEAVEAWCAKERAALVKERRLLQRQAAGLVSQPLTKKDRAEVEALKATVRGERGKGSWFVWTTPTHGRHRHQKNALRGPLGV